MYNQAHAYAALTYHLIVNERIGKPLSNTTCIGTYLDHNLNSQL